MLTRDNIRVITPALFQNQDLRPLWMLMHTAQKFNVPVIPYGMGCIYKGWVDIKVHKIIASCQNLEALGISHLLYMDGRDTMLLSTIEEVLHKYQILYGAPPLLMSAEPNVFDSYASYYHLELYPDALALGHPYCYPGSSAFMGEVRYIRECLEWMLANWDEKAMPDDDPAWWRRFDFERREELVAGRIQFDHDCEIFVNAGGVIAGAGQFDAALEIRESTDPYNLNAGVARVYNKLTGSWPVVLHFDGGYSHELYGKWDRLETYWKQLGYGEIRPPWEGEVK